VKVCIVIGGHWSYAMGGAEYQVKCLIEALIKRKTFDIYMLTRKVDPNYEANGYKINIIKPIFGLKDQPFSFDSISLSKELKEIQPDVIYERTASPHTGICAYYAKKHNSMLIWHIAHDDDLNFFKFRFSKNLIRDYIDKLFVEYGIRNSEKIIAQTIDQTKKLEKNYHRKATAVIRNFHPLPNEKINKSNTIKIVWIANLKPIKQPEIFIRLAKDLEKYNVSFVMAGAMQGRGRWKKSLLDKISEVESLNYIGFVNQDEINLLLAESHILVNTSLAEGFSNTFIQAWMRQVPVVSLHVNPDNILSRNQVGFYSKTYDGLRNDVENLISNSKVREQLGRNSKNFSFENHVDKEAQKLINEFKIKPTVLL